MSRSDQASDQIDERLFGEAINLAIRLQSGVSAVAGDEIRAWRSRSPAHERIWAEVAEIQGLAGAVLQPDGPPARPDRRRVLGLVLAATAAGALGTQFAPGLVTAARADHRTGTAEQRRLWLGEGSSALLGPDSAVIQDGPRSLRLLSGMILCDIAPDPVPFRLTVDQLSLIADPASFCVSRERAGISVTPEAGRLLLAPAQGAELVLTPGLRRRLDGQGGVLAEAPSPPGEAMGWSAERLVTRAEPVAVLVEQIARWLPGRVVLADSALGALQVGGTFDLRDPEAALQAVVLPHGGRVRRLGPWLRVVSRL